MSDLPPDLSGTAEHDSWGQVESACDHYVELHRAGTAPSVEAYAAEHGKLEAEILEMLPTVMLLELARQQNLSRRKDGRVIRGPETFEQLGDYEVIKELGRGGMGIVYEAFQASLNRHVALKVLPRQSMSEVQKNRFLVEASIIAGLHHSNIVPVFTVGEDQGVCFYAMEKLSGIPLDRFVSQSNRQESEPIESPIASLDDRTAAPAETDSLQRPHRLTVRQVVEVGVQISDALAYAHRNGVIHRDVKPANLILADDQRVWLTDFGLAVGPTKGHQQTTASVSGTLRYVSPERIDGVQDDETGDIYSLAISMMELLTGEVAFPATRRSELIEQIRANQYRRFTGGPAAVPDDLQHVLKKASARDPQARYPSASEFHDELVRVSQDLPVQANPLGPIARFGRWCRRNVALASVSTLAFIALAAVAVISTVSYFQTQSLLKAEKRQRSNANNASKVAHQALDEIYQQLNIGTGSTGVEAQDTHVLPSERSTYLLNQLTRFYEQLAANDTPDLQLPFDPVEARRRVGQLHLRLGNYEDAVLAFNSALTKLQGRVRSQGLEAEPRSITLRAQILNETGLAKRISGDREGAIRKHQIALQLLQTWAQSQADKQPNHPPLESVEFEIARTYYFLGHRTRPGMGPNSYPPPQLRRPPGPGIRNGLLGFRPRPMERETNTQLTESRKILERLIEREGVALNQFDSTPSSDSTASSNSDALAPPFDSETPVSTVALRDQLTGQLPEHLHLLALTYRELANDNRSQWRPIDRLFHDRSISILHALRSRYPNETSYQYDLVRSLAEMIISDPGTSPKDLKMAQQSLVEAIQIGESLVDRFPSVNDFRMEVSHAHHKLAMVLEERLLPRRRQQLEADERTAITKELEESTRKAWQHQLELIKNNPDAPAFKVWGALFVLNLAELESYRQRPDRRNRLVGRATTLLGQLEEKQRELPSVRPLVDRAERLSLQGLADPPSSDMELDN